MSTSLLVVEMGIPHESLRTAHGSFGQWFSKALGQARPDVDIEIVSVYDATSTLMSGFAGVILSGAEEGVYDDLPWRSRFDGEMLQVIQSGPPVLGVCFSHQYLSELLGGSVARMKDGGEFGRVELKLTDEGTDDPLFAGIGMSFGAFEVHNDAVVAPPPGGVLLASGGRVAWQAFRWGERIRGVQFHPEMDAEILACVLTEENAPEAEIERARLPHSGLRVLSNFVDICTAL